jgi:hypothetical protein
MITVHKGGKCEIKNDNYIQTMDITQNNFHDFYPVIHPDIR